MYLKFRKHSFLSFLLACSSMVMSNAQTCSEEVIFDTQIGNDLHRFGSSVDMGVDQFIVGTYVKEKCYLYEWISGNWQETIFERPGPPQYENFGFDVAVDGDRVVVGAPFNLDQGFNAGSVYVYDWDGTTWNETQILASNGGSDHFFGFKVDVHGDRIIVGAPFISTSYIYDLVAGVWQETILQPTSNNGEFGESVAIKNDTILIGAPISNTAFLYIWDGTQWIENLFSGGGGRFGRDVDLGDGKFVCGADLDDNANGNNAGSIYIYEKNGAVWNETKILASDGLPDTYFGRHVSISGDSIVVGVEIANGLVGKGYIFEKSNGTWNESQVSASDGNGIDQYGVSVSILNGDFILGARYDSDIANQAGSAYLYSNDNSSLTELKFSPSDATPIDKFGIAVGIDHQYMIIGASGDYETAQNAGAAHVFKWDGSDWVFDTKLLASEGNASDNFGKDVDVHNNRVVIGSPDDSDVLSDAGSAYIYEWDGASWLETKITPSNPVVDASFGSAVAIFGDRVVVGNSFNEVYLFELVGGVWTQTQILTASNSHSGDRFGYALDIIEDRIAVGARFSNTVAYLAGAAYIYDFDGTNWVETFVNGTDIDNSDLYGSSIALYEERMVVGAPGHYPGGSAYIFDFDGTNWVQAQKVVASDAADADGFGTAVGISHDRFVVGARSNDDDGGNSGSIYVYDFLNNNWEETKITASDANGGSMFGHSVDMYQEQMMIGTNSNYGRAYYYSCPCIDDLPPVAQCQDLTLSLDSSSMARILVDDINMGSYDDCGIMSMSIDQLTFDCSDLGMNSVTLSVTDSLSNVSTCLANVEVQDPLSLCIPCDNTLLTVTTSDIVSDDLTFHNSELIESDAYIPYNNILFKAKTSVELQPNFELVQGKIFTIEIGDCN